MHYQCPKCQSDNLTVAVTVYVKLVQYEDNQETEYEGGDHEWDDSSTMTCNDCQHADSASAFEVEEEDPDTAVIEFIQQDSRYTVTFEHCGHEKPKHVARFCNGWVGAFDTENAAWQGCFDYQRNREKGWSL